MIFLFSEEGEIKEQFGAKLILSKTLRETALRMEEDAVIMAILFQEILIMHPNIEEQIAMGLP